MIFLKLRYHFNTLNIEICTNITHRSNGHRLFEPSRVGGRGGLAKTRGGVGTYTLYSHKNYLHTRLLI